MRSPDPDPKADIKTMDLLSVTGYCLVIYVIMQFVRFIRADADFTLLWAEYLGNKPETKLFKKVVWITGASTGIGEELAYQLAKLGASLVLSSRSEVALQRVKQHCLDHSTLQEEDILVLTLDLNETSSHEAATKSVIKHFGKGFFNSLRPELANYPGIVISMVCPGLVHSNIVKNAFAEEMNKTVTESCVESHKMPTARCARLMLIGMANGLKEMWISEQPLLFYVYLWQYAPTWAWLIADKMSVKRIKNLKSGLDADATYFGKIKGKTA
ncbi:dehydrogenase/reductase SDR family member 7 isoform X4 [Leucoraja erinacea]|uniref:dehydrogenase/reductase SDR family member 7 isoform X4 n=1 Tax=Leucoraja erinaceus TaxID=7782 RepID=UPI002457390A|nr:dehydrogenase/reductase SDR family member 7 isoform X4 [Leucoraja erinacea]